MKMTYLLKSILLCAVAFAELCSGEAALEIAVYVPPSEGGILTTRNFAFLLMFLTFLYLFVMLI